MDRETVSKEKAKNMGLIRYFTGEECANGHVVERYTKNGMCVECSRIAVKEHKQRHNYKQNRKKLSFSEENIRRANEAESKGEIFFIPERPCPKGHSLRFVKNNNCVQCNKDGKERNKEINKHHRIKREYGISKEEYDNLLEKQNWCCAICNKHEPIKFKLHTDHCHDSGKVRGLLCGKCNQGIGLLNHSKKILECAIEYLEGGEEK